MTVDDRARFARDGFVVFDEPICDPADVLAAKARIDEVVATVGTTRDLAYGDPDGGRIDEVEHLTLVAPDLLASPLLRACLERCEALLGEPLVVHYDHLIVKPPRNRAATVWHQDLAYGEGERAPVRAAHCWIPLQDVTPEHGCMQFVPGSHHRLVRHRRRGGLRSPVLEATDVDASAGVACPLPLGGMTVHDPRVLHATGPNRTDGPRAAWVVQLRPPGGWSSPTPAQRVRAGLRRRLIRRR